MREISTREEREYKLAEHVGNYDHCQKYHKGGEEFDMVEIRETGKGEIVQGGHYRKVPGHWGEDEGKLKCPKGERYKTERKSPVPLPLLAHTRKDHPDLLDKAQITPASSGRSDGFFSFHSRI